LIKNMYLGDFHHLTELEFKNVKIENADHKITLNSQLRKLKWTCTHRIDNSEYTSIHIHAHQCVKLESVELIDEFIQYTFILKHPIVPCLQTLICNGELVLECDSPSSGIWFSLLEELILKCWKINSKQMSLPNWKDQDRDLYNFIYTSDYYALMLERINVDFSLCPLLKKFELWNPPISIQLGVFSTKKQIVQVSLKCNTYESLKTETVDFNIKEDYLIDVDFNKFGNDDDVNQFANYDNYQFQEDDNDYDQFKEDAGYDYNQSINHCDGYSQF